MGHHIINYFGSEGWKVGIVCYRHIGEICCVLLFPLTVLDMCCLYHYHL